MFVDGHEINPNCHRSLLFEPILPLKASNEIVIYLLTNFNFRQIEKDLYAPRAGHDTPDKNMPIAELKSNKGLEMYNTIIQSSSKYRSSDNRSTLLFLYPLPSHRSNICKYILF